MKNKYAKAAVLGTIAGMRSLSAPALVSLELEKVNSNGSKFAFLTRGLLPSIVRVLAIGEFLGDKLPSVPNRIQPLPLIARILSGAVSGAAICSMENDDGSIAGGAAIGAVFAAASSFLFYFLRRDIVRKSRIPDTVVALVEDGLVAAAGRAVAG